MRTLKAHSYLLIQNFGWQDSRREALLIPNHESPAGEVRP